jgi:hypothetical protein
MHRFWADDLPLADAVRHFQGHIVGHKQVTDAYLLGLAMHRKSRLATLDESIGALFDPRSSGQDSLVVIGKSL